MRNVYQVPVAKDLGQAVGAGVRLPFRCLDILLRKRRNRRCLVINELLRNRLGFRWLVMTDWWSVYDGVKTIKSGQDLEMPYRGGDSIWA